MVIRLPEEVVERAEVAAARRGTSLSDFLAQQIYRIAETDDRYERAKRHALEFMEQAGRVDRGGRQWAREEIHDRWTRS